MKIILFLLLFFSFNLNAQQLDFEKYNFKKADSIAKYYKNHNLKSLPILAHKLTSKLDSEIEKFRAIYFWVSTNIESDYYFFNKNKKKRKKFINDSLKLKKWNETFKQKVFKKLLEKQKTVCTGYAYLIRELSLLANINCKIINGYGRTTNTNVNKLSLPNHSWNAVKLNEKWYLCDATWSSGFFNLEQNKFIKNYNNGYFLTPPKLFIKNHYPINKEWTLIKTEISIDNFIKSPIVYGASFKYKITPIEPKRLENKVTINETILFKFMFKKNISTQEINLLVANGHGNKKITPKNISLDGDFVKFEYSFSKRGLYDVHLTLKDEVVTSYTFKVNKK